MANVMTSSRSRHGIVRVFRRDLKINFCHDGRGFFRGAFSQINDYRSEKGVPVGKIGFGMSPESVVSLCRFDEPEPSLIRFKDHFFTPGQISHFVENHLSFFNRIDVVLCSNFRHEDVPLVAVILPTGGLELPHLEIRNIGDPWLTFSRRNDRCILLPSSALI